jgi:hypothetical protein
MTMTRRMVTRATRDKTSTQGYICGGCGINSKVKPLLVETPVKTSLVQATSRSVTWPPNNTHDLLISNRDSTGHCMNTFMFNCRFSHRCKSKAITRELGREVMTRVTVLTSMFRKHSGGTSSYFPYSYNGTPPCAMTSYMPGPIMKFPLTGIGT